MQELHTQAVIHIHTQTHVYPSPPFHAYKDLNLIHSISKKKMKETKILHSLRKRSLDAHKKRTYNPPHPTAKI